MKIGIFDPYLDSMGGGERYIIEAAVCLAENNTVDIFFDDTTLLTKAATKFGLNVGNLNIKKNIFSPKNNFFKKIKETKKYDVFIFVSDGSIPFLFSKKNILLFQYPVGWVNGNSLLTKFKLGRIGGIVVYSEFVKKFIDKKFNIKSIVIPPAVNQFLEVPQKKENVILTVGRFTQNMNKKKQEFLLQTFKKMYDNGLKGWQLFMIGSYLSEDKIFVEDIERQSKGLPVKIMTDVSYEKLKTHYNEAKIYWHAAGFGENLEKNPERAEHFGISTVEAMSAGAVPVVINAGGQKEIIEDEKDGFLWDTQEELIDKTEYLIKNEKLRMQIADAALNKAKVFSVERFCEKINKLVL